jgi:hypothetical protein
LSLAPDGRFALGLPPDSIKRIVWLPTGTGEARQIEPAGLRGIDQAWFLADGSLVIAGRTPENAGRLWRVNKDGGELRPLTPPQWTTFIGERPISPDQSLLATTHDVETVIRIHPIDGKESWLVPGLGADDVVSGWTADSKALYVYNREGLPARVYRVDVHSGRKELWRELMPADPAGVAGVRRVLVTPDARAYVYGFPRTLSELYLVEGMH